MASAETLAESETPPFPLDDDGEVDELLRLSTACSTCAAQPMQDVMALRHTIIRSMRDYLNAHDFLDIETPILTRSTPEGARDFLVPSRLSLGAWYALPQSPQLFKQLLMMSGYERYYQIARCFRDEDLRGFRQPEFTQLDLEMSFVEEDDVIELIEGLMSARVRGRPASRCPPPPWPRLPYAESMLRFGNDKPGHALRPRDRRPRPRAREDRVQGLRRACSAPAAWCAGSTRARARCRARSSTR